MQFGLADLDRWIAPDQIEGRRRIDLVGSVDDEIRGVQPTRVAFGELARPGVDVDRDDSCRGSTAGECQRDRAGTATQIEKDAGLGWSGRVGEQELGAGVEPSVGEDAVVALEFEGVVGKDHRHEARS